jgi:hypothetical protein
MTDFVIDSENDLIIQNGDFAVRDSLTQDVAIILELAQGGLKSDPILGPNLVQMMRGIGNQERIARSVKLHLARDNKDYNNIKEMIRIYVRNY